MRINEYQELAQRTSAIAQNRRDKLLNGCMGLIGETGEVVDALKKWRFQSGENAPFPGEKIVEECGDVLWYIAEVCSAIDVQMDEITGCRDFFTASLPEFDKYEVIQLGLEMASCACSVRLGASIYDYKLEDGFMIQSGINSLIKDMYYMCGWAGYTLEGVAGKNIEKLKKRYPDGFDPERSLHRQNEM